MHKATVAALVDLLAVHAGAAVVEVGFGEGIGPVKPVNGVGQPPMIGQLADWSMMHYQVDMKRHHCCVDNMPRGFVTASQ